MNVEKGMLVGWLKKVGQYLADVVADKSEKTPEEVLLAWSHKNAINRKLLKAGWLNESLCV